MSWLAPKNATSAVSAATVQISLRRRDEAERADRDRNQQLRDEHPAAPAPGRQPGRRGT